MSDIIDYRVVSTDLYGISRYTFEGSMVGFIKSVNALLKRGYSLHGSTKFNGRYSVTQALVKYSNQPSTPYIDEYKVLYFAVEDSNKHRAGAKPVINFEKDVLDELNNGWTLCSDLEIYRCVEHAGMGGIREAEVLYAQALVKYRSSEINLLIM